MSAEYQQKNLAGMFNHRLAIINIFGGMLRYHCYDIWYDKVDKYFNEYHLV